MSNQNTDTYDLEKCKACGDIVLSYFGTHDGCPIKSTSQDWMEWAIENRVGNHLMRENITKYLHYLKHKDNDN